MSYCQLHSKEAFRMTDLLLHFKDVLNNTDNCTRQETKPLLHVHHLCPSWRISHLVQQTHMKHLMENIVIQLAPVFKKDFSQSNGPAPDTVVQRTLAQLIIIPVSKSLSHRTHLDLALDHAIDNLIEDGLV